MRLNQSSTYTVWYVCNAHETQIRPHATYANLFQHQYIHGLRILTCARAKALAPVLDCNVCFQISI
jgi:hypothetical protein